jgi:DNA-binding transcriptional ArsR family regulator
MSRFAKCMEKLDDRALDTVAEYFRALAVPLRLKILNALREGELNVSELTERLECSQANVSKHLSVLARNGLVERTSRGTSVYYSIADPRTYQLCDLVCGQIGKRFAQQADLKGMFLAVGARRSKQTRR